jgi:hypothetical protein
MGAGVTIAACCGTRTPDNRCTTCAFAFCRCLRRRSGIEVAGGDLRAGAFGGIDRIIRDFFRDKRDGVSTSLGRP